MLIIGNKPFQKLKINKLLDSFKSNIRCNMGIPKNNNGLIKDQLAVCSHIYDNFVVRKSDWDTVFKVYGKEYKEEYLEYFYENFSIEDYNTVWYADASNVCSKYNSFLDKIGCSHRFNKQPRTGLVCILNTIMSSDSPSVFGFSITKETRKSYYVNDFVFQKEDEGRSCHSKQTEVPILRWLHENNFIDATLCMLKDEDYPILECNNLQPSEYTMNLLKDIYGKLEVQ